MYSFHASAATYTEFWNDTFHKAPHQLQVTCRIIWQTFIQESIQQVAEKADISLALDRNLGINKVTQNAYKVLGESGKIRSADRHSCAECTHAYKKTPDIITEDDPAAVVNINENRAVPALVGEGADLAVQDAAQARQVAARAREQLATDDDNMDIDDTPVSLVNMVVLDGIVMGHTVSYFSLVNLVLLMYMTALCIW
jgi:hypothetical protein